MAKPNVGFTVRLTPDEHERLRELAREEHRSLAAQARMMLVAKLEERSHEVAS